MKYILLTLSTALVIFSESLAQGVLIGDTAQAPNPSAILELRSNEGGFLVSRMTTTERNAVANPASGLQIFNTTNECLEIYFPAIGWSPVKCACTNPPAQPGAISGYTGVCNNQQNVTYSIAPVPGASSYTWGVPPGAVVTAGQGTTTISVTFGNTSGSISVAAVNSCGVSLSQSALVTVSSPNPAFTYSPGTISVLSNITFSAQATGVTYTWTFQNGNPGTGNTQNPVVSWANTGTNTVKLVVQSNPACRDSSTQQITVINCPPGSQSFTSNGANIYSGTPQTFVVPNCVTSLNIECWGAQGGGSTGGLGAYVKGTFSVTPGEVLTIIVGKSGGVTSQSSNYCAGGGGGSYVYRNASDPLPLIVAAGGGGQAQNAAGGTGSGNTTPTSGNGTGSGTGGTGGNGGAGGPAPYSYSSGGGGGGWLTNGGNGIFLRYPEGQGGKAPINNANGGIYTHPSYANAHGGYGGGGGASDNSGAGGGGGGYNGGGGGTNYNGQWGSGGGAGSYNGGINQTNTSGVQTGNGQITITW